ncbi:ABC transporter ATP-binding protein [Rothia sp. 32237D007AR]
MFKCENISKSFQDKKVIEKFNLNVNSGDVVALQSPSGGGKSTLINIMSGLMDPDSGFVSLNNINLSQMNEFDKSKYTRMNIGVMHQANYLFDWMSVEENLEISSYCNFKENDFLKNLIYNLRIHEYQKTPVPRLSGGQKRRICFARAFINSPKLVLLDEPTTGLDKELSEKLISAITEYADNGNCVVIATHDENLKDISNKIINLQDFNHHE